MMSYNEFTPQSQFETDPYQGCYTTDGYSNNSQEWGSSGDSRFTSTYMSLEPEIAAYRAYVMQTLWEIKMGQRPRPTPEDPCSEEEEDYDDDEDFGPADKARRRVRPRRRPSIYDPESDSDFDPDESDGEILGEMWIPPSEKKNQKPKPEPVELMKREDFLASSNLKPELSKVLKALKEEPLPRPEKPIKYILDYFGHEVPSKEKNEKIGQEIKVLKEKVKVVQSEIDRKHKLLNDLPNPDE